MYVFEIISSLGTFGALCAAIWQLHLGVKGDKERDEDGRVERSLQLFDEVVAAGGTAEAFHRLSVALREQGTNRVGRTSWHCLSDTDLDSGGFFDVKSTEWGQLFADLYTVLWFFERVETALQHKIVNRDVLMSTLGFHFWWWGEVLQGLRAPKASASLHKLASEAEQWARTNQKLDDWCSRCQHDFGGNGARCSTMVA